MSIPPLDVAWFHVRGELLVGFTGGICGCISGVTFGLLAAVSSA